MAVESSDVVIVGAGIIGLNIAYQIARRSRAKIVVLEKGASLGEGSTGASSAVCRSKYSRAEMVKLATNGIAAYQNWQDYTGLETPRATYHKHGMLWLADDARTATDAEAARLSALGVGVEVIDSDGVSLRFPALSSCLIPPDLETGAPHRCKDDGGHFLFETEAGYVDPVDALQDLLDACRNRGVDVRFQARAIGIDIRGGTVKGVTLADGAKIECPVLVNAAGAWCNDIVRMAGLAIGWPLTPTRIQVVHIDRPPEVSGPIPITCDVPGGIYFRTQNRGQQLIVGSILADDEREAVADPDHFARYVDDDYARAKLHALEHRLPALQVRGVNGYSGLYTVNREDVHPVVGRTEVAGLFLANGCSGHGFKLAPALGALVARDLTSTSLNGDPAVEPTFLSVDRSPIDLPSRSVLA